MRRNALFLQKEEREEEEDKEREGNEESAAELWQPSYSPPVWRRWHPVIMASADKRVQIERKTSEAQEARRRLL
jgi:hypothetical protein